MAGVVEHVSGPTLTRAKEGHTAEIVVKAYGYSTVDDAANAIDAYSAPAVTNGGKVLTLVSRETQPDANADDVYIGRLSYVEPGKEEAKEEPETNDEEVSVNITGGSEKITASFETNSFSSDGKNHPSTKSYAGAINVDADGKPQGVNVVVPQLSFTVDRWLPFATVTAAWTKDMAALVGKTNDAAFKGYAAGELLLLGITANRRGTENWRVQYQFAAGENRTDLQFPLGTPTIQNVEKGPHEYLWADYRPHATNGQTGLELKAVYVEKVYQEADFSLLGLDA